MFSFVFEEHPHTHTHSLDSDYSAALAKNQNSVFSFFFFFNNIIIIIIIITTVCSFVQTLPQQAISEGIPESPTTLYKTLPFFKNVHEKKSKLETQLRGDTILQKGQQTLRKGDVERKRGGKRLLAHNTKRLDVQSNTKQYHYVITASGGYYAL